MKCVICKGSDIELKTVDEQVMKGKDIILIPMNILVCSNCGERYYDRKAMKKIEEIRSSVKKQELDVEEVGDASPRKLSRNTEPGCIHLRVFEWGTFFRNSIFHCGGRRSPGGNAPRLNKRKCWFDRVGWIKISLDRHFWLNFPLNQ